MSETTQTFDGLKLTVKGGEIIEQATRKAIDYRKKAEFFSKQKKEAEDVAAEEDISLSNAKVAHGDAVKRNKAMAARFEFIKDHIDGAAVYHLTWHEAMELGFFEDSY